MSTKQILVYPAAATSTIWLALEQLTDVEFRFSPVPLDFAKFDAVIIVSGDTKALQAAVEANVHCLVLTPPVPEASAAITISEVTFSGSGLLDSRLRRRQLPHQPVSIAPIQLGPGDILLAHSSSKPIWVKRSLGGNSVDLLAVPLPVLGPGELPFNYLNGDHFIQLLPLVHFLREVAGRSGWEPPPLRACFMFDDPNLHWTSYGYLPYPALAKFSNEFNFHVAFATIPLDAWFVHGSTARLFRQNTKRLSILFHGNDHLRVELGRPRDHSQTLQLLAQSLRRIQRLEQQSGLSVSRIMAPPHGACRPQVMDAMLELGFEAACISGWSLLDWGGGHSWPPAFSLLPAEMVSDRFPVIPRFRLAQSCLGSVIVSAFLDRPIIPVGHHDSVSSGLDLMARVADTINSLGKVCWSNLESIARSGYALKSEGTTLRVRPHTLKWDLIVPEGVGSMVICPLSNTTTPTPTRFAVAREGSGTVFSERVEPEIATAVTPGERICVASEALGTLDFRTVSQPAVRIWPSIRRILCETRDRLKPLRPHSKPTAAQAAAVASPSRSAVDLVV